MRALQESSLASQGRRRRSKAADVRELSNSRKNAVDNRIQIEIKAKNMVISVYHRGTSKGRVWEISLKNENKKQQTALLYQLQLFFF